MPTVTVSGGDPSGGSPSGGDPFAGNEDSPFIQVLEEAITAGLESGALTALPYTSGTVAPAADGGVVIFTAAPTTVVEIPTTDVGVVITGGPTTITGGAPGETVVGGSSGLTYTNITPSGSAIDYIAVGDGANLITTSPTGTGNYQINTGAGNDTIAVHGNGLINAGSGHNSISVSGGSSFIYSEGNDTITGSKVLGGGGTDTVRIGLGQATINPGSSNFVVTEDSGSTKPLFFGPGSGSDIVSISGGGGTVYGGSAGNNVLVAGASNGATTMLYGAANGDQLYAVGSAPVVLVAGAGAETLSGAGETVNGTLPASTADNTFKAGSGNDMIFGGAGNDTADFDGLRADYALTAGPGGTLLVTGIDGGFSAVDTLSGIETLAFADETIQAPCFAQGTHILTTSGEVLVQDLRLGDVLVTGIGAPPQAIRWIGCRRVECYRHPDPHKVLPIRVAAHAFGHGYPHRDLFLSPDHAVFAEGVLIPVNHLVNGTTVRRVVARSLTYYHIELEQHDVVLAEGLLCESYLDTGDRAAFSGGSKIELYPTWGSEARDVTLIMDALGYAPLQVTGPEVERVRAALASQSEKMFQEVAA